MRCYLLILFAVAGRLIWPGAGCLAADEAASDRMKVVVRVYENWREKPGEYARVEGMLERGFNASEIKLDPAAARGDVVIVIASADQDKMLPELGNNAMHIWHSAESRKRLSATGRLTLAGTMIGTPEVETTGWGVSDVGYMTTIPGPETKLELYERREESKTRLIELDAPKKDASGNPFLPHFHSDLPSAIGLSVIVSHPDYGIARVNIREGGLPYLQTPLVRKDSEEAARAAQGVVTDEAGKPIAGAAVTCRCVRTPGEGLIEAAWNDSGDTDIALTDEEGRFRFYQRRAKWSFGTTEAGELVPPGSRYFLKVAPPAGMRLFPYSHVVTCGEETTLVMKRGESDHTIVFRNEEGGALDLTLWKHARFLIQQSGSELSIEPTREELLAGGFPTGRYLVTVCDDRGRTLSFPPIQISPSSPDEIVFQVARRAHRRGRIVHGETGEAIGGAFVFGMVARTQEANLAEVTDAEWEKLRALPEHPEPDERALKAIYNHYSASGLIRSAEDGSFDLIGDPGENVYSILAVDKDFIPVSFTLDGSRADQGKDVEVGELRLYPAAKVRLKLPGGRGAGGANAHWMLEPGNGAFWASELDEYGRIKTKIERGVDRPFIIKSSPFQYVYADMFISWEKATLVFVPAGCALRLRLTWPYNDAVSPMEIPKVIELGQGDLMDVGAQEIVATVPVGLLVTDEAGQALEGIPVRALIESNCWTVAHNSDATGMVWFMIPPGRPSKLGVIDFGEGSPPTDAGSLKVSVQATGEEKPAPVFRLTMSAEAIGRVIKQEPRRSRLDQ